MTILDQLADYARIRCEAAKKHNLLVVQGRSFGCPGFVRISYCVSRDTVVNSLPAFKTLAEEYRLI